MNRSSKNRDSDVDPEQREEGVNAINILESWIQEYVMLPATNKSWLYLSELPAQSTEMRYILPLLMLLLEDTAFNPLFISTVWVSSNLSYRAGFNFHFP
jgi:hypothetical protein